MNQSYSQELRADTLRILIPIVSSLTVLISLVFTISSTNVSQVWHYWVMVFLATLGGFVSWHFIKQNKQSLGSNVFLFVYLLIVGLLLYREWTPENALPYLFGVLIVAGSMIKRAETGLIVWFTSCLVLTFVAAYRFEFSMAILPMIIAPIIVNLALALVSYLSAMEWQYAVETVSDLHRKVQRRRDELFNIQEELKWANARLEHSNRHLEEAREEALAERDIRTRFMNHVSHELRTPLNSIVNFAHIIRLGGRGSVSHEQADYLDRIEKSGWHLLSVLNALLDMAQIEAGEFKLDLAADNLHDLCEEAMTTTRGLLVVENGVDLRRDYPEAWPSVNIDRMRIKQALINLLGNAVKYTEEGLITLRVRQEGDEVWLSVIDSGIGIAPEHHEAIFQEFRQVDESHARRRIGTGLGLSITRHLIERHHGRMWVESEVGQGSNFTIALPIYDPTAVVLPATTDPQPELTAVVTVPEPAIEPAHEPATVEPPPLLAPDPLVSMPVGTNSKSRLPWVFILFIALFLMLVIGYGFGQSRFGNGDEASQTTPTAVALLAAAQPSPSPSATATMLPSPSPTAVAQSSPTPTATASHTASPTATATETATAVPPTPTLTASPSAEISDLATALLNVSLYRSADATSPEITYVEAGQQVTVDGRSANGNWLFVTTADQLSGFAIGERLSWNGDVESLPIVPNPTEPVTAVLRLDVYPVANSGRCNGTAWQQTIFMRGQGGNGTYSYFWNGQSVGSNIVNDGITFDVNHGGGGALTGVAEVVSGQVAVSQELFIPAPPCN